MQTLYKHFSADNILLYVGVSSRIPQRLKEHSKRSPWWENIARIELCHFPDRKSVLEAERQTIITEKPAHNIRHVRKVPITSPPAEPSSSAEVSGDNITARIVGLRPLYREKDAAETLGISTRIINREIAEGRLGYIEIASPVSGKPVKYISGWQIIDWLEACSQSTKKPK